MVTPAVAIPIQGEMVHDIDAAGGLIHDVSVRHSPVEIVRRETHEFQCGFTNAVQATSAEVEDSHGIAFAQQELDETGPDETGPPATKVFVTSDRSSRDALATSRLPQRRQEA